MTRVEAYELLAHLEEFMDRRREYQIEILRAKLRGQENDQNTKDKVDLAFFTMEAQRERVIDRLCDDERTEPMVRT